MPYRTTTGRRKRARIGKWGAVYIMAAPGLIYLLINNYIPMAGLVIAFKKIDFRVGILESPWVGLSNFTYLFKTKDAYIITRNTILYNMAFLFINTVLGVLFAIFISDIKSGKGKKIYQTATLLPYLMSTVIVSYIVYAFLSPDKGMINHTVLNRLGKTPVSWYMEDKYWPFILTFVNTWKGIGYGCLVYIAGIAGIDSSYFEAARMDGASKWQQIRYITLPGLKQSVLTLNLLNIGKIFFSDFGLFYQVPMNSGALFDVTNTIDTYVYRSLIEMGNVGMASAAGFYQSLVGFILVIVTNMIVRRIDKDCALF